MKLALAILLVAALGPQGKPPAEIAKAEKVVADRPDDAEANDTLGRYYASQGAWDRALPHFSRGSDEFLRVMAEREATSSDAYALGESWWTGALDVEARLLTGASSSAKVELKKRASMLRPIMRERAAFWFTRAWPSSDDAKRAKMTEYARVTSTPSGAAVRSSGPPSGWTLRNGASRDGTYAHGGRFSISISSSKEAPNYARIQGAMLLIPSGTKEVVLSAFVRAEGQDPRCSLQVGFWTAGMDGITQGGPEIPAGPFWTHIERVVQVPEKASKMSVFLVSESERSTIWVDDISLRTGDREFVENGGFEK